MLQINSHAQGFHADLKRRKQRNVPTYLEGIRVDPVGFYNCFYLSSPARNTRFLHPFSIGICSKTRWTSKTGIIRSPVKPGNYMYR